MSMVQTPSASLALTTTPQRGESIEIKPATFEEAIWCIENAEGLADSWIYEIQELMENHYEIGMLSDERVIEICEDVDLNPADYLQDPEKFGF